MTGKRRIATDAVKSRKGQREDLREKKSDQMPSERRKRKRQKFHFDMQEPTGLMMTELDDIIGRPFPTLATARDLPRLVKNCRLTVDGATVPTESVRDLVVAVHAACGAASRLPEGEERDDDFIRAHVAKLDPTHHRREMFIFKTLNQNVSTLRLGQTRASPFFFFSFLFSLFFCVQIIAPAVLRLKYALANARHGTKDGEWHINVFVETESELSTRVVHTRCESRAPFEYEWSLTLRLDGMHELELGPIRNGSPEICDILAKAVVRANRREDVLELPPVKEYMSRSYFNW